MAGIEDVNVVDVVGQGANGECILFMVESRPWGVDPQQPAQLREKINAYAGFILDGSLARHYPETVGRPVRIQLDCIETPTDDFAAITDHAARALEGLDIGFRVNVQD